MVKTLRRSVSTYLYDEPGANSDTEDSFDFDFTELRSEITQIAQPLTDSIPVVYWPYTYSDMPVNDLSRGVWFLKQLSLSASSQPGAFVSPSIFIPSALWSIPVSGICARQICMRAAFIMSLGRTIQDMKLTPKLQTALERKIAELWDGPLVSPQERDYLHGPPSPPIKEYDQFPGPVRIHRTTKSRIKSLMHRRSVSPPAIDNDYLFQIGNGGALQKYASAISAVVDALALADSQWTEFVVFDLASHIGSDILSMLERYMDNIKNALVL